MKKQILNTIGFAAVAALLCVTCGDNGLDTSPKKIGDVDRFLGRINSTDTTGGGTPSTPATYTLTIAATSGGTVSPAGTHSYANGTTVNVTATATSGYEFTEWTGTGAPTPATTNPVTVTMNANKALTANFKESGTPNSNIYTVTFNINGGSGTTPSAQTVYAGSSITLPNGSGFTKEGHTFDGWNTQSDGEGTNYTESYTPTASITLYAKWNAVPVGVPPTPTVTTFRDERDGRIYKKVTIGKQVWMAENLNYDDTVITSDVCLDNDTSNCAKYGRLYDWATAMGGARSSSANPSGVQGVCPAGWHLPSDAEWTVLTDAVGGLNTAGTKLKSSTGWNNYSGIPVGTNEYGWSALPGGGCFWDGSFTNTGYDGNWWSATENDALNASYRYMLYRIESVDRDIIYKTSLYSVRCVANQ